MKKGFLPKLGLSLIFVLSAGYTNAQMVDCDIFLKGNHMEVGINSNGAFGTSVAAPTGYHVTVTDTLYNDCTYMSYQIFQDLGFVVDPNLTGWTSYYGDYILPGNPREGWAIEYGAGTATAYSYNYYTGTSGFSGPLIGANTAYSTISGTLKGTWNGSFHSTLNVNQVTTVDITKLYLMVHVGFYNTGTTLDSFYYLRTINPHNDQVTTSNPNTRSKIVHQLPNPGGLVVVEATGIADTLAYIALGTKDPRAKCFIIKDSTLPGPGTLASIWAGDITHYIYSDTLSGDHGIGLVYKIGVGPGDSSFLDYGYSFKGSIIDTVLDTSLHSGGGGGGGTLKTGLSSADQTISLYPNPVNSELNISGIKAQDKISIYDITGRLIASADYINSKNVATLSVGLLQPGIYMAIVRDASNNIIKRLPFSKQ